MSYSWVSNISFLLLCNICIFRGRKNKIASLSLKLVCHSYFVKYLMEYFLWEGSSEVLEQDFTWQYLTKKTSVILVPSEVIRYERGSLFLYCLVFLQQQWFWLDWSVRQLTCSICIINSVVEMSVMFSVSSQFVAFVPELPICFKLLIC